MKVLVADQISKEGIDILRRQAQVDVKVGLKPEEIIAIIGGYEGLVVRSQTRVTAGMIQAGEKLQVIAREILKERNWPDDYVHAVMSHGWGICTEVQPREEMEKALYAIDELTGLVAANAMVRPSGSVIDMKAKSVKKKFKDKAFAAKIDRDVIAKGAEMLGVELSELITETIEGMKTVADKIGLGMKTQR